MITIKTKEEIDLLRQGGHILAEILDLVVNEVRVGVSTAKLNQIAEDLIKQAGGRPSFKNYGSPPFPCALCTSVNSELVHGVAKPQVILKNGDIISLDIGMQYPSVGGLYTDMAKTVAVGKISKQANKLMEVTKHALNIVEQELRPGIDLQLIAAKIQNWVEKNSFNVIRDLVGHGVGHQVHEDPQIPNYVIPNYHVEAKQGMVLAFEPMVSAGSYEVITKEDQWTVETEDKSLTAHYEHTFAVTETGNEVLTRI